MTPEQKAKELFEKFKNLVLGADEFGDVEYYVIEDATIEIVKATIDEIISACEFNHVEHWNNDWWNKVKAEIEKI